MEKVKWVIVDFLTKKDLHDIEDQMSLEELHEMKRKSNEVLNCMPFDKSTDRLIAENAFRLGYLAAHGFYQEKA